MADTPSDDPYSRSPSPPPWISPTLAISAIPYLDRSVSTASSSSVSGRSVSSNRSVSDGGTSRRRGYMRPQATVFSDSARNRESVMSLGSIAHLQYYFARTGLLDGKGGQFAKGRKESGGAGGVEAGSLGADANSRFLFSPTEKSASDIGLSLDDAQSGLLVSPDGEDETGGSWEEQEPIMLPPTVSTYLQRPVYVPPPPNIGVLRRELRETLEEAEKGLLGTRTGPGTGTEADWDTEAPPEVPDRTAESQGWYEIEGLHILDTVTLAIRAARNYYTAHEQPQRLYALKSERQIRTELYQTLDILKRMATRNFAGGVRQAERQGILGWIRGISSLLDTDEATERAEEQEREKWSWREGDWTGREREREWLFLKSFAPEPDMLPPWTEPPDESSLPTPFIESLRTGLRLVLLHNALVRKSRRQFEEIRVYHTDTAKPYRCAENLRFWIKAAELRWEVKLRVDVMGVVHGVDAAALKGFETALLMWSKAVREEITAEWREQKQASQRRMPTLRIDTHNDGLEETEPVMSPAAV
ncbi:hypothetical protein H2201_004658 [Coniosporium apollinis]|uniref:Uncharacterized protein n=1 Tax=Coniosporium apollinis TaxID=61459 RepID=A0ABQ9NS07_9PEZI|nr:hypothetical protein H2201_004658 [Coniosporium apollinis]